MIDKGGTLINTNTQEIREIPDCYIRGGEKFLNRHTHSPDRSPHPETDHPWGDLLQDRHYHHYHLHSNCKIPPTEKSSHDAASAAIQTSVFDGDAGIEMPLPLDATIFV